MRARRRWATAIGATVVLALMALTTPPATAAPGQVVERIVLPIQHHPRDMARAPNGNLWFGSDAGISFLWPDGSGSVTSTNVGCPVTNVASAPAERTYFSCADRFGLIDLSDGSPGSEDVHVWNPPIPVPPPPAGYGYQGITFAESGPDGGLWLSSDAASGSDVFVDMHPELIYSFPESIVSWPEMANPRALATSPAGLVWYLAAGHVGWFDPTAVVSDDDGDTVPTSARHAWTLPGGTTTGSNQDLAFAPDGTMWFTTTTAGRVGIVDPALPSTPPTFLDLTATGMGVGWGIVLGPDGNLWVAGRSNRLVRIDPDTRQATAFPGHAQANDPAGLGVTGNGQLWATTYDTHSLIRIETGLQFQDVGPSHPFFGPIIELANTGIAGGYSDGGFRPGASVSRQAMAAFLFRLANPSEAPPTPTTPAFPDVGPSHPFWDEVQWAADADLVNGYPDGTFQGLRPVTRQAMAALLYRLSGELYGTNVQSFSDVPLDHPFHREVEWLASHEISTGYQDDTFRPSAPVTRQAMAAFLIRFRADPGVADWL
jgi:streptogramin lyase